MPRKTIYLIGSRDYQIIGSKLPTLRDCMKVLFFSMRTVKMYSSECAYVVTDEYFVVRKKPKFQLMIEKIVCRKI